MARKKKVKPFRAVTAVKALARERLGTPRPEQVAPDRKKQQKQWEKHKTTLAQWLSDDS